MASYGRRVLFLIDLLSLFSCYVSAKNVPPLEKHPADENVNNLGNINRIPPGGLPPNAPDLANMNPNVGPGPRLGQMKQNLNLLNAHMKPIIPVMLSETQECGPDIARLCSAGIKKNNFAILECLQLSVADGNDLSEECHHFVWVYRRNLTKDDRFEAAGREVCYNEFRMMQNCSSLPAGEGKRIPCMIEHFDSLPGDAQKSNCKRFLTKMASIIFSDYHLVWNFMEECSNDISTLSCGRIDAEDEEKPHKQGATIHCLASKVDQLTKQCKKQVLRVAELQSDDYHMDRQLYYACRDDREKFCAKIHSGGGKVYECLFRHKKQPDMSARCREMLVVRQKLMAEDVKVEKTFYLACKADMKKHKCWLSIGDGNLEDLKRSAVLLCLENALKKDQPISPDCMTEMNEVRRSLMEDYEISPEIVTRCHTEIQDLCGGGVQHGGKTLHCLMQHANPRNSPDKKTPGLSNECKAAIEDLIHEADVGSDFTMDAVLVEACEPVIESECSGIKVTSTKMLNCLMEKLDSDHMTDECEQRLLELQYFIVRDFRLDPQLYKGCHKEAKELCHAADDWYDSKTPTASNDPMIFPCLYRQIKHHRGDGVVSRACRSEVKRVMRQRAKRVDLDPLIEDVCLHDLAEFCSNMENYERGEEIKCLQDALDDLSDDCHNAVSNFTEDADDDLELDVILMRACTPMIKRFCEPLLDHDADAGEVMDCLIEHKNHQEMNTKCAAGVNHHQLISLKDFRFTHKFKEACKASVMRYCKDKNKKYEVVVCLSEIARNDTLTEQKHRIDKDCRRQLRVEILQREENINLDPVLKEKCQTDIDKYCSDKHAGNAQVIECLKDHQPELGENCHKLLFKREKVETALKADYNLMTACKSMIEQYCSGTEVDILDCLKVKKNKDSFDPNCRAYVVRRQIQENKDYRLNPSLMKSCSMDIPKFCKSVLDQHQQDTELEGKVINCLKQQFINRRLSHSCDEEIRGLTREVNQNIELDPILMKECRTEIKLNCYEELKAHEDLGYKLNFIPGSLGDTVIECLKTKVYEKKIDKDSKCAKEVERLVKEGEIDIHNDPLLADACKADVIHWCQDLDVGDGRHMACLLAVLEDHPKQMKVKCRQLLVQRKTLWEMAAKPAPAESFSDLTDQITSSPSKVYFLGVLISIVGVIFIVGLTCGRVTKRVTAAQKNK